MGLFRAKIWKKYGILGEILTKIWDIYGTFLTFLGIKVAPNRYFHPRITAYFDRAIKFQQNTFIYKDFQYEIRIN